jgi:hypothetical protein
MKSLKTFFAAGSVALALVSQASADVTLRCTGSTALRAAAHLAMRDMLVTPIYKYSSSTLAASTSVLFQGTIAGQPGLGTVTIKCTWSGSTDGIKVMANGTTTTAYYADATGATLAGAPSITTGITETGNAPDMILMDTSQALTPYQANPIDDTAVVGILPFVWVASKDAPAGITNMTAQIARQMHATGYLSASAFTGDPADSPVNGDGSNNPTGTVVYMPGRDNGSGTRTSTLAETAYGSNNLVLQVQPTASVRVSMSLLPDPTELAVLAADQAGVSLNMVGKPITGTNIPVGSSTFGGSNLVGGSTNSTINITVPSTSGLVAGMAITGTGIPANTTIVTVTDATHLELSNAATATASPITFTATPAVTNVTGPTINISNPVTAAAASVTTTIGNTTGNTVRALYYCPEGGNGGQSSGGTLSDQLRFSTNGATDPFGLQANFNYSDRSCFVTYLGLSDADRAVNGTGSSVSVGTNVGCRYLSYEGVSCMGGAPVSFTIASQGAGVTVLTTATDPIALGVIDGQLMAGTGIAPGTTVVSRTTSSITLSAATTNAVALVNNVVKATQFLPKTTRSGQYSFWSYARVGFRTLTVNQTAVKDKFVAQITSSSTDLGAVSGLPNDDNMRVTRSEVGQPISLKY